MKNFIFALLAALSSFSVSAQTVTISSVFFESFEGTGGAMPATVTIYNSDSCTMSAAGISNFVVYPRNNSAPNDSCVYVRSTFTNSPPCQANDWVLINQPIDITANTWLSWWRNLGSDTTSGPQFGERYGIYLADTIEPNRADNFLTTPVFTSINELAGAAYDSISLSAYAGQRKYIGFRYFSVQAAHMSFDDFFVYEKTIVSVDKYTNINYAIYPNPSTTNFTVESEEMGCILIYNALGQLLEQQIKTDTKQSVNIANLDAGLYIVQLQTKKGAVSQKIQKQ